MVKKFLSNGLLLLLVNLLVKPYWLFGVDRLVQNRLPVEYGLYFALFNFTFLFNLLLDFGVANYNSRTLAQHPKELKKNLSTVIPLKVVLFLVYLAITIVLAIATDYSDKALYLIGLLCFNQGLSSLLSYLRSNLVGLQLFRTDSLISGLDKVLMILLCLPLLYGSLELSIELFVFAQGLAYLGSAILVAAIVLMKSGRISINLNFSSWIQLLKKTYPYALLGILMSVYIRVDAVMLERMLPNGQLEAGVYAEGYRLLDALVSFLAMLAALLLPMFSRQLKSKENFLPLRRIAAFSGILTACFISILCWMWSSEIVEFLYPGKNPYNVEVFEMVMWSLIPMAGIFIYGTFLTAAGDLWYLNIIAAIAVVLNITLNSKLIPDLQAYGSAFATLITQIFVFGAHYIMCIKKYWRT